MYMTSLSYPYVYQLFGNGHFYIPEALSWPSSHVASHSGTGSAPALLASNSSHDFIIRQIYHLFQLEFQSATIFICKHCIVLFVLFHGHILPLCITVETCQWKPFYSSSRIYCLLKLKLVTFSCVKTLITRWKDNLNLSSVWFRTYIFFHVNNFIAHSFAGKSGENDWTFSFGDEG